MLPKSVSKLKIAWSFFLMIFYKNMDLWTYSGTWYDTYSFNNTLIFFTVWILPMGSWVIFIIIMCNYYTYILFFCAWDLPTMSLAYLLNTNRLLLCICWCCHSKLKSRALLLKLCVDCLNIITITFYLQFFCLYHINVSMFNVWLW